MGGFLSALGNVIAGPIGSILGNPGSSSGFGTNNLIGEGLNDITGQSASARQQFQNQMKLQKDAQGFAKWQMQNAHQTEVSDLKNAGLNPVLSANNGASAGVTEGSAAVGHGSGADAGSMISGILGTMLSAKKVGAEIENLESQSKLNYTTSAKTETEKEILDIQRNYIAPLQESIIDYNVAGTSQRKADAFLKLKQATLANAQALGQEIENSMHGMEEQKRKFHFQEEMDLYASQLAKELIANGVEESATYQIVDHIMNEVGKVFHIGLNFNHSTSKSTVNSTSSQTKTVKHTI